MTRNHFTIYISCITLLIWLIFQEYRSRESRFVQWGYLGRIDNPRSGSKFTEISSLLLYVTINIQILNRVSVIAVFNFV